MTNDEFAAIFALTREGAHAGVGGDQQLAVIMRNRIEGIWQLAFYRDDTHMMDVCDRCEWMIRASICRGLGQPCFMPGLEELAA